MDVAELYVYIVFRYPPPVVHHSVLGLIMPIILKEKWLTSNLLLYDNRLNINKNVF